MTMNSMRGAVPFEVDGQSLYLRLTTNAQVRYQDRAGESLVAALGRLQAAPDDLARIRRVFWAGLSHMDGVTEDVAGDLMDALGSDKVGQLIGEAIKLAFPSAEGNGAKASGRAPAEPKAA